jgi:hypothetical protein
MKGSIVLIKIGSTLWAILAGVSVIVVVLYKLEVLNAELFPWRIFAAWLGVGGLVFFVIAGIVAIWEGDWD